jgi:heme/copper-type cytochrome/quinol oxidase subunit 3
VSSDHSAVSVHEHPPPSFGVPNLKLAFWLFLASDCMLFGSLIATYLSYRGKDQLFGNGPYPLDLFSVEVTTISTFDLLMSSVTMVLAVAAIQRGEHVPDPAVAGPDRAFGRDLRRLPGL